MIAEAAAKKPRTKKQTEPAMTLEEVHRQTLTKNLASYREYVKREAGGERLMGDDLTRVEALLTDLKLPQYAWLRDIEAVRNYAGIGRQLAELRLQLPAERDERDALQKEIEHITRRLAEAKARLQQLSHRSNNLQVDLDRRQNELSLNHPHLFHSIADAVEMRMQVEAKRAAAAAQQKVGWLS